jgi:hypothetical protein
VGWSPRFAGGGVGGWWGVARVDWRLVGGESVRHVPFTALGALGGVVVMGVAGGWGGSVAEGVFWVLHPLHVVLSAMVTTAMYVLHGGRGWWRVVGVGWCGAVGVATLSDCVIPWLGEWVLGLEGRGVHVGFVEKWWLVNPLALAGVAAGWRWRWTRLPHAAHVLLSTWASLMHTVMAAGGGVGWGVWAVVGVFLFLAVWVPCCTSDIVFPLVMAGRGESERGGGEAAVASSE